MTDISQFDFLKCYDNCVHDAALGSENIVGFHFKTDDEIKKDWLSFFDGKQGHHVHGVSDDFETYHKQVIDKQEQFCKEHNL